MNTKQLFSMILALLLCCGLSVPAAAESRTASVEPEFWFRQDFDGLETVNQSSSGDAVRAAGGLWVNTGFVPALEDGALLLSGTGTQAFWDFQFWNTEHGQLTGDFVLSMRLKPAAAGLSYQQLVGFRRDTSSTTYAYVSMSDGRVVIAGDDGSAESPALPTDAYTAVELLFRTDAGGCYSRVSLFVGGDYIGSRTLTDPALTSIAHFRNFLTYGEGSCYLDDLCIVRGAVSVCGTDLSQVEPGTEAIEYLYHEDFSGLTSINMSTQAAAVAAAGGLVGLNATPVIPVEDGAILLRSANGQFLDFQFYSTDLKTLTGDFTLSFRLLPEADGLRCDHLVDFRKDTGSTMTQYIRASAGRVQIFNDPANASAKAESEPLPAGEYSSVELFFGYDADAGTYSTLSLWVNGIYVGERDLTGDGLTGISQFRMFRYHTADIRIRDLCVARGNLLLADNGVEFYAVQETVPADGVFSARFAVLLDRTASYTAAGIRLSAEVTQDGGTRSIPRQTVSVSVLWESLCAREGTDITRLQAPQGSCFAAVALSDIPAEGTIVFTVTPYAVTAAGRTVQARSYTVTYQDGVFVGSAPVN